MNRFLLLAGAVLALLVAGSVRAEAPAPAGAEVASLEQAADEIAKEVEGLRGWTFKEPVKKAVATPAEARALLERQMHEHYPPERVGQIQASLRLVGLVPPSCDLSETLLGLMEEDIGGCYDPDTRTLYLVRREGRTALGALDRSVLAHELEHALDDQYADLKGLSERLAWKTEDMDLALRALLEGSATVLMQRFMFRQMLADPAAIPEMLSGAQDSLARSASFLEAPSYFHAYVVVYFYGSEFLLKGDSLAAVLLDPKRTVGAEFLAAAADPPRSTEQILHPAKYWTTEERDEPVVVDDAAMERLLASPGRHVVHADTFGEMLCAILTAPADSKPRALQASTAADWTNAGAAGWGGDRFYLVASGPDAQAAGRSLDGAAGVWVTVWDTPQDRDEFLQAYERGTPLESRAAMKLGNLGAVFFFGLDDPSRRALEERLEASPPPLRRGDAAWSFFML